MAIQVGDVFTRLTILDRVIRESTKHKYWLCICVCGERKEIRSDHLTGGRVLSCGCLRLESVTTMQGMSKHRLHNTWYAMNDRCYVKTCSVYHKYGARGIRVCKRWSRKLKDIQGFINFLKDMESTFEEGLTLDRIDNNMGYNRHNCKWSTDSEQTLNRRKPKLTSRECTSKYIGVCMTRSGNYIACVKVDGSIHRSSRIESEYDAAIWRDEKILELGVNATLNILTR